MNLHKEKLKCAYKHRSIKHYSTHIGHSAMCQVRFRT